MSALPLLNKTLATNTETKKSALAELRIGDTTSMGAWLHTNTTHISSLNLSEIPPSTQCESAALFEMSVGNQSLIKLAGNRRAYKRHISHWSEAARHLEAAGRAEAALAVEEKLNEFYGPPRLESLPIDSEQNLNIAEIEKIFETLGQGEVAWEVLLCYLGVKPVTAHDLPEKAIPILEALGLKSFATFYHGNRAVYNPVALDRARKHIDPSMDDEQLFRTLVSSFPNTGSHQPYAALFMGYDPMTGGSEPFRFETAPFGVMVEIGDVMFFAFGARNLVNAQNIAKRTEKLISRVAQALHLSDPVRATVRPDAFLGEGEFQNYWLAWLLNRKALG